jgi:hypothetical protein
MAATESYYKTRIRILEESVVRLMLERDVAQGALGRWETNAKDVGWDGENPASWIRSLAREINDIPLYKQIIKDLSESVDRLARSLSKANGGNS